MLINGTIFSVSLMDILTELKRQLSANGVHRFAQMFDSGDDIMCSCPFHKNGQERRPSCGIRKSDAKMHCFTCGITMNLDEMVARCFGYEDPAWGYHWLTKNFLTVEVSNREAIKLNVARVNVSNKANILGYNNSDKSMLTVSEEELDRYRYFHPYMYKRGLTDDIIDLFDIGYDAVSRSITFPVKDSTGNCLFVARRSVSSKRFDLPVGIEKPLYGLHEACQAKNDNRYITDKLYVTEGVFDCFSFWRNWRISVAGFGCLFSEYQLEQLRRMPFRHIVLALDNDEAGREGAEKIKRAVKNKIFTRIIFPEGRKDTGECTDEEILNMEEVFF